MYSVQLMILIDIKENKKARKSHWSTRACQKRVEALLEEYGNSEATIRFDRSDAGEECPEGNRSDDNMYSAIEEAVDIYDWVGSIEADIDFWEAGVRESRQWGPKIGSCHFE